MSDERIKQLFQRVPTEPLKLWIAQMIAGAIIADRTVQGSEKPYLEGLFQMYGKEHPISQAVRQIIDSKEPPHLEQQPIEPELAEEVFECLLEICGGDQELHVGEIQYLREMGGALGIDYLELQYLIKHKGIEVKAAAFHGLAEDLTEHQRSWLAMVILSMIFSDEHIAAKEGIYLGDLDDLLHDKPDVLRNIKINPREFLQDPLPAIVLKDETKERVVKYLLGLAVVDGDLEETEETIIRNIASTIGYSSEILSANIENIRSFQNKRKA